MKDIFDSLDMSESVDDKIRVENSYIHELIEKYQHVFVIDDIYIFIFIFSRRWKCDRDITWVG